MQEAMTVVYYSFSSLIVWQVVILLKDDKERIKEIINQLKNKQQ